MSTPPTVPGWIYYERREARGRASHGWVCSECRKLLQTG